LSYKTVFWLIDKNSSFTQKFEAVCYYVCVENIQRKHTPITS